MLLISSHNDVRNSFYCRLYINKLPPKGNTNPHWRLKYWHLLINPFHGRLQKVEGKVDGFVEISRETMIS